MYHATLKQLIIFMHDDNMTTNISAECLNVSFLPVWLSATSDTFSVAVKLCSLEIIRAS